MDPNEVVAAARALVHLWQNDARTALVALDTFPELGNAIEHLVDSLAPTPAKPGVAMPVYELRTGDEIRFAPGPFEDGVTVWTVHEVCPDDSRPPGIGFRLVTYADGIRQADDYFFNDKLTLVRRP